MICRSLAYSKTISSRSGIQPWVGTPPPLYEKSVGKVGREQTFGTNDCKLVNIYNDDFEKFSETRNSIEGITKELYLFTTRSSKHVSPTEAKVIRHPGKDHFIRVQP